MHVKKNYEVTKKMKLDLSVLQKYYDDGLLIKQTHPSLPLTIWNYSRTTEYERKWDDVTIMCRGLVTHNETGDIVARPFKKFFNIEENKHTPTKYFDVFKKEDGSLIIVFQYNGQWIIASRGSFTSDQAVAAEKLFYKLEYDKILYGEKFTYLFEYCADWNRIVVRYDTERLILLGMIETKTDKDIDVQIFGSDFFQKEIGFVDVVKKYNGIDDFNVLKKMIPDDEEGFVVKFSNGDRCKIKGEEYLRLHKLMTNVSTTSVWENLMNGKSMDDLLVDIPDEFFDVVKATEKELDDLYWKIADEALHLFKTFYVDGMSAKDFADRIKDVKAPYHSLLFCQFNLKFEGYSETIWKHIKPEFRKL